MNGEQQVVTEPLVVQIDHGLCQHVPRRGLNNVVRGSVGTIPIQRQMPSDPCDHLALPTLR